MLGRDIETGSYRVAAMIGEARVEARVPEALMAATMPLTGGRGHQVAYEWLAKHQRQIETAIGELVAGRTPRAPFDQVNLIGD